MDMEKHLIIEQQGVLGIISLNRVANLNALSIEMIHQIHMQFETWQQDHSIQAILIKSNSQKAFCAGGDIRYLYDNYIKTKLKRIKHILVLNTTCLTGFVIIRNRL